MWSDNAQSGAGGFLDSTYNGGEQTDSTAQSSDRVRGSAIVPLMIGHLHGKPISSLNLWGQKVSLVSIVGIVKKIERATTKNSYEIQDETGTIQAIEWIKEEKKKGPVVVPIDSYARVVGTPREQQGKPHLMILKIIPIVEYIDVHEHILEVTHLCITGKNTLSKEAVVQSTSDFKQEEDNCYGMSGDQTTVFNLIRAENGTDTGIERSVLISKLPPNLRANLEKILEFLISEGHIYTTCTDDHFKTT